VAGYRIVGGQSVRISGILRPVTTPLYPWTLEHFFDEKPSLLVDCDRWTACRAEFDLAEDFSDCWIEPIAPPGEPNYAVEHYYFSQHPVNARNLRQLLDRSELGNPHAESPDSGFLGASEITNTIDAGEDAANELDFSTGALADGTWYFRTRIARSGHTNSDWSNSETETIDATAPTISTASTANCAENATLAITLAGNETVTWSIVGGADQTLDGAIKTRWFNERR
jgi:hypothetical protein